ncbi:MAG: hypothetical protein JSW67_07470 [Candidatus Latescibacterota bacterium]|nr:MAG: hypothetical protein JSW67_07470 [Candidatus Latescibacterota bacterium]
METTHLPIPNAPTAGIPRRCAATDGLTILGGPEPAEAGPLVHAQALERTRPLAMESPRRVVGTRRGAILVGIVLGLAAPAWLSTSWGQPQSPSSSSAAALESAHALVDSLLGKVGRARRLAPLREVEVEVADRARIRSRLEEIARADDIQGRAERDEILMKFLGLLPPGTDLLELYEDLLVEQLAGMYDIDERVLVLADWLPASLQQMVVTHELVHALQDQHFSLRVRKKLGFDNLDAEAAWHALMEGDAMAVMIDMSLRPLGVSFTSLADSLVDEDDALMPAAGSAIESQRLQAAPRAVRDAIGFPYVRGVRFVAALYEQGGWERVDDAYIHPPISTEQVLHPERYLGVRDEPVRIELPDVRGFLGSGYRPRLSMQLGEFDLALYLREHVDPGIASVASEGWGGCEVMLYGGREEEPDVLVLSTIWDTEDDALEFFGALLGALEQRYPEQTGVPESSHTQQVAWNLDEDGRFQNVLRWRGRRVLCLERVPAASVERVVSKLDRQTRYDDPTPDVRRRTKEQLPWNHTALADADSALTLHVDAPPGWSTDPAFDPASAPAGVKLRASRAGARLEVAVDPRRAGDRLGISGYTHELAQQIRQAGSDVYIHTDVEFPRADGVRLYQHIFTQVEEGKKVVYYIGVADLKPGYGYVRISEPQDGTTPSAEADFYRILDTLELLPDSSAVNGSNLTGGSSRLDGN